MARLPTTQPSPPPRLERALLARVLAEPRRLALLRDLVGPEDFTDTPARRIFEAMIDCGAADLMALHAKLAAGNTEHAARGWGFTLATLADDALEILEDELDRRAEAAEERAWAA